MSIDFASPLPKRSADRMAGPTSENFQQRHRLGEQSVWQNRVSQHTAKSSRRPLARMLTMMLLIVCVTSVAVQAESRLWTSADGKTRVYGELVGTDGQSVYLRKRQDRQVYTVPLSMLSAADQKIVQKAHPEMFSNAGANTSPGGTFGEGTMNSPAGANETSQAPPLSEETQPASDTAMGAAAPESPQTTKLNREGWDSVRKTFPALKVFAKDGIPALGLPIQSMLPRGQGLSLKEQSHWIGAILTYLTAPSSLDNLAEELPKLGFENGVDSGSSAHDEIRYYDYLMALAVLEHLYPEEEYERYREALSAKVNDFERAQIAVEMVKRVSADLAKIRFPDGEVPLTEFTKTRADRYDPKTGQFPLQWSSQNLSPRIGNGLEQVDLIYTNTSEEKIGIPATPEQAAQLATVLESEELLLKQDIILSSFRRPVTPGLGGDVENRANAELVALTLVPQSKPDLVIHRWEFKRSTSKNEIQPLADQLEVKMQQLASQHQLKTFQGYPAVRTDGHRYNQTHHPGSDHRRFSTLLDRVAIGLDPNQVTPTWIARHIPEAVGVYVDARFETNRSNITANWYGSNEFTRRDSQSRFFEKYQQKINDYAVELPIRFVEFYAIQPREYDFERQGFELDLNIHHEFPHVLEGTGSGARREIPQWRPDSRTQTFVSVSPDKARALYRGAERAPLMFLKRVVTWDHIDLPLKENSHMPPVMATSGSYELYVDATLQDRLAVLSHDEARPAYVSGSELVALPGPNHPLPINTATLSVLAGEPAGSTLDDDQLLKRFDKWKYFGDERRAQLSEFTSTLDWANRQLKELEDGERPAYPEQQADLEKIRNQLEPVVAEEFSSLGSPFLPSRAGQFYLDRVSHQAKIEVAKRWQKWLAECIESNERHFVISMNIQIDPDIHDLAISSGDPKAYGVTQDLVNKGTPEGNFLIIAEDKTFPNSTVCLQFPVSLLELLSNEQALKDALLEEYNHDGQIELVFTAGDVAVGKDGQYERELLISAVPKSYRLLDGSKLKDQGTFDVATPPDAPSTGTRMTGQDSAATPKSKPSADDEQATATPRRPITPATTLLMLGRYLPEMANKYSVQLMRNRYKQENEFRSMRDQQRYGVDPSLGLFYPINTPNPEVELLLRESPGFQKWLKGQSTQLGDKYRWRVTAKFGQLDETISGYPLLQINTGQSDYLSMTYQSRVSLETQLSTLKRRQQSQQNGGGGFGGGGGGFGGGGGGGGFGGGGGVVLGGGGGGIAIPGAAPGGQQNLKPQIETLEKMLEALKNSPTFIDLGEVDYRYRMEDLDGRSRTTPDSKPKGDLNGYWNPDDVRSKLPSEAIYPMLALDSQIYLPQSLGIEPSGLKFEIELEFEVTDAMQQETPTASFAPEVRQILQASVPDYGRYVLFQSKVTKCWLLHPVSKERLHEIGLRRVKAEEKPKS